MNEERIVRQIELGKLSAEDLNREERDAVIEYLEELIDAGADDGESLYYLENVLAEVVRFEMDDEQDVMFEDYTKFLKDTEAKS